MSALISAFIAGRHRRLLLTAVWGALFLALLVTGYGFIRWQVASHIRRDHDAELGRIAEIRSNVVFALRLLQQTATSTPCSRDFLVEMQRVAFLPDGLNEFLYAPDGSVKCSTSQPAFPSPVPLGAPDIEGSGSSNPSLWIDRDLTSLGRPAATGTIAALGAFAVAIPPYSRFKDDSPWLHKELVIVGPGGKVWTVAGDRGLYQKLAAPTDHTVLSRLTSVASTQCDADQLYCVTSTADLLGWGRDWATILSSVAVLAALFAWICATNIVGWLSRYWSFEARFGRHLNAGSVVLEYQPIVDLKSGEVAGCEVLARWRDVDGTIVPPSRFIEIVARLGRTAVFTRMVAERAYDELTDHVPPHLRLQVSFNVFACDFTSARLLQIFSRFVDEPRRFDLAIELVENENINFEEAQRTIQELKRAGVSVYIDDFGIGYSSIERVAILDVHGVKLDRSFAMAPTDSILGRMLMQVLEMMKTSGHSIVIEGVETEAQLSLLRSAGSVDYVQGYVIAPPLGISEFVRFLANYRLFAARHITTEPDIVRPSAARRRLQSG